MFSRVTHITVDPDETDVITAVERFRQEALPSLQAQEGYLGLLVLAGLEGRGLLISFWETEEAASAGTHSEGLYSEVAHHYRSLLRATPRHDEYEVLLADGWVPTAH